MSVIFSISICPASMEIDGDILDEDALFQRIRDVAVGEWGDNVRFDTLQVGHSHGHEWAKAWENGQRNDSLADRLIVDMVDWTDEDLYEKGGGS